KVEMALAPIGVAAAACAIALLVALLDVRAQWIVLRARRVSGALRVEDTLTEHALDVGVGEQTWIEHCGGRVTYREHTVERIVATGDLHEGSALLRAATLRSLAALIVAVAAEAITTAR